MKKPRFKNLNLLTLRFPFTAILSILHRLSGIFVFIMIPALLWMLSVALSGETGFTQVQECVRDWPCKITVWLLVAALGYHLLAGVRHIVMDIGWGESLRAARVSGALMLLLSIIWAVLVGIWLW